MNELEEQNTSVIMTPDANGRPSKQKLIPSGKAGWPELSIPTTVFR